MVASFTNRFERPNLDMLLRLDRGLEQNERMSVGECAALIRIS